MAHRRRHFTDDTLGPGPLCKQKPPRKGPLLLETDWHAVDCEACQVVRYLAVRRRRRPARPLPVLASLIKESTMRLSIETKALILEYVAAKAPLPPCAGCPPLVQHQRVRFWTRGLLEHLVAADPEFGWVGRREPGAHPSKGRARPGVIAREVPDPTDAAGLMIYSWAIVRDLATDDQRLDLEVEADDATLAHDTFRIEEWRDGSSAQGRILEEPRLGRAAPDMIGPGEVSYHERPMEPSTDLILRRLAGLEAMILQLQNTLADVSGDTVRRDSWMQGALGRLERLLQHLADRPLEATLKVPLLGTITLRLASPPPPARKTNDPVERLA